MYFYHSYKKQLIFLQVIVVFHLALFPYLQLKYLALLLDYLNYLYLAL